MDEVRIRSIFNSIDLNGDGLISKDELRKGMRQLHIPYSQSSVDKFMEAVDTNHDGFISFCEFHAAVLTQQERLKRAFRELDHGGDNKIGTLDLEKWAHKMGVALSHDEIKQLVDTLDTNNSGHVELNEFCEYFLTQVGDVHAEGLFESWMKGSAISAIPIPDIPQEEIPSWITLVSGATAGVTSRTLTAPADRLKTLLQAGELRARKPATAPPVAPVSSSYTVSSGFSRGFCSSAASLQSASSDSRASMRHMLKNLDGLSATEKRANFIAGNGALGSLSNSTRTYNGPVGTVSRFGMGLVPDEELLPNRRLPPRPGAPLRQPIQVHSLSQGFRAILADGGVKGFWRGNGINVLKVAPETATRFWAYERFKALLCDDPDNITIRERFAAGASAGAVSQMAIYPLEVAKTRFALSTRGQYRSALHCLGRCVRSEGAPALYRGLLASLVGIVPYSGVDLALYSLLKDTYADRFPDQEPGLLTLLACGATATTCAQVVSYPLQLIRTRLQAQGMEGRPILYKGIVDCFAKTVRAEGFRGLYRGILPNFMKSVPAMAISYATYETTKRFLVTSWRSSKQQPLFA